MSLFNPKDAIIQAVLKSILEHKEEYLERAKEELLKLLQGLDLNDNDVPDVEEAKAKLEAAVAAVKDAYDFLVSLVQKAQKPSI